MPSIKKVSHTQLQGSSLLLQKTIENLLLISNIQHRKYKKKQEDFFLLIALIIIPEPLSPSSYFHFPFQHGTGILGDNGGGTSEQYGVCKSIDIVIGTFSKALAVTGGFVAASRDIVQYLRFFSRPYMFSASIPPPLVAAVIAGLDIIATEPERRKELRDNVSYFVEQIADTPEIQLTVKPEAGIVAIRVPENMNAKKAAAWLDNRGIFLNAVEYPAVPLHGWSIPLFFMDCLN